MNMQKEYEVITNSRFYLELKLDGSSDLIDGYFMECQGFKRSQEVIKIHEVTHQKWGIKNSSVGRVIETKVPGNFISENIKLKSGMTISSAFWDWFMSVEKGNWSKQCRDGDLTLYNQAGEIKARFRFLKAWPISYKISDVKADSSDFQVEEVDLAVEQFLRV